MLTKKEIMSLVNLVKVTDKNRQTIDMILRNYNEDDLISSEKLEVICQLMVDSLPKDQL